jgi:hypothetical protein
MPPPEIIALPAAALETVPAIGLVPAAAPDSFPLESEQATLAGATTTTTNRKLARIRKGTSCAQVGSRDFSTSLGVEPA